MKVNESKSLDALSSTRSAEGTATSAPTSTAPKDRVSVDNAREVKRTVEAVQKSVGTQRASRLAQIEQAVRSGAYKPDPAQVAAQILADAEVDAHLSALLGP